MTKEEIVMKLFGSFVQGGQTQLHKLHMIRQVLWATCKTSLVIGILWFCFLIYKNFGWKEFYALAIYYGACLRDDLSFLPYGFLDRVGFPFQDGQFHIVSCSWLVRDPAIRHFVIHFQGLLLEKLFYAFLVMLLSFFSLSWFWMTRGKHRQQKKILQGTIVVKPHQLKKLIKRRDRSDLSLGGVPLLKNRETEHMMIVGTTGTGKSNSLHHLLGQIRARGDRAVIIDTTGSLVSRFYEGDRDKLLNPLDKRSLNWDLWSECKEPYHYTELAQSLIPESGSDPIWWTSARRLFVTTAQKLQLKNQQSIKKLLKLSLIDPISKVASFYEGTQVSSFMNVAADKTALSVRSTLGMYTEAFAYLESDQQPFSIRSWVRNELKGEKNTNNNNSSLNDWLFLSSTIEQRELLAPLLSTWLSIAYKALMGLEESYTRRLWFIVDELPSLNMLPNLPKALAEIRKYGGCFVIGLQNLPQLEELYGVNLTRSMAGLCGTKVVFRTSDAPTAKKLSEFFGEQEILEPAESISFGAHQMRDGVNLAEHRRFQATIPYTNLLNLNNLQAYLQLPGNYPLTKIDFDYLVMENKSSGYDRPLTETEKNLGFLIDAIAQGKDSAPSPTLSVAASDALIDSAQQPESLPSRKQDLALREKEEIDLDFSQ
jgi:type IV conjugative transfer system coupling protein TraD